MALSRSLIPNTHRTPRDSGDTGTLISLRGGRTVTAHRPGEKHSSVCTRYHFARRSLNTGPPALLWAIPGDTNEAPRARRGQLPHGCPQGGAARGPAGTEGQGRGRGRPAGLEETEAARLPIACPGRGDLGGLGAGSTEALPSLLDVSIDTKVVSEKCTLLWKGINGF